MASFCLMAVFIEPRLAILAELYVAILTGPEQRSIRFIRNKYKTVNPFY